MIDMFENRVALLGFLINVWILNYWLIIPSVLIFLFYTKLNKTIKKFLLNSKILEIYEKSPIFSFIITTVNGKIPI